MCGILGIFRTAAGNGPLDAEILKTMRDTMSHRGPDDAGLYLSPRDGIGLAHRRLSIIDLSKDASQPMSNDDESLHQDDFMEPRCLQKVDEPLFHCPEPAHDSGRGIQDPPPPAFSEKRPTPFGRFAQQPLCGDE